MLPIQKCEIPAHSLLEKYLGEGGYADSYCTEVPREVAFPEFVFAFYTTALFKLERWILEWAVSRPSTDDEAREVADGLGATFAAWDVEGRRENELLMCDLIGRTRSWLMIVPVAAERTKLFFGSAVVLVRNPKTGKLSLGFIYHVLLGFHRIYSVLLLYFAKRRIMRWSGPFIMTKGDSL